MKGSGIYGINGNKKKLTINDPKKQTAQLSIRSILVKFQIFQHLPHTLLQVKDNTKIREKTNSLHIYINRAN